MLILINWVLVPFIGEETEAQRLNVSTVTKLVSKKAEISNQNLCVVCIMLALELLI